jgi:hypothetical protein
MARLGHYFIEGQPLHVVRHGNNREPVFFAEDDHAQHLQRLIAASVKKTWGQNRFDLRSPRLAGGAGFVFGRLLYQFLQLYDCGVGCGLDREAGRGARNLSWRARKMAGRGR